jgi:hypothetical protein
MFLITAVASLCAVVLIAALVRLACQHGSDSWINSDDAILCFVSPLLILLLTFGGVAFGYRLTNGGLAAVPAEGWIGSAVIAALSFVIWAVLARRIRGAGRSATGAAPVTR